MWVRERAVLALRRAFERCHPEVALDDAGYAARWCDVLLPEVPAEDVRKDLEVGSGQELSGKFRAVHSSAALAVNAFGPFKRDPGTLKMPWQHDEVTSLRFEAKCPTGLSRAMPPNLDVLLRGKDEVIGVESKLTEYLAPHRQSFSERYSAATDLPWHGSAWFDEMERMRSGESGYRWLDAAQLIKHAFGLANSCPEGKVSLLYLYWEPANPEADHVFGAHREEIARFAEAVRGDRVSFQAASYRHLWEGWSSARADWLAAHLDNLRDRYDVTI